MAAGGGTGADAHPQKSVLATAFVALSLLGGCGGRAALDTSENGGTSAGASGNPGVAVNGDGTSATGGAPPVTSAAGAPSKPPCCNLVASCNAGDEMLEGDAECPPGASCYSLAACCGGVIRCAYVTPPLVDAGPAVDAGSCNLLDIWATHSAPWNGESTDNAITFRSDGTLSGGTYFTGSWSVAGSTLTIENTKGLDMDCVFADHWTLTFSADCQTAQLLAIDSGCTGARRYLDGNVFLTREFLR